MGRIKAAAIAIVLASCSATPATTPPPSPSASSGPAVSAVAKSCIHPVPALQCVARPLASGDPTPWPRASQLVDTRPIAIHPPASTSDFATLSFRDDVAMKLEPKSREALVAAEAAYASATKADAKWPAAKAAYEKFLTTVPGDLEGYARSMLARVLFVTNDVPGAIAQLRTVIGLGSRPARGSKELADAARRELVTAYATSKGSDVYAAVRDLAPPGAEGDTAALEMVAAIASEGHRVGNDVLAAKVFEDLIARDPKNPKACVYEVGLATSNLALKVEERGSYAPVERLVKAALRAKTDGSPAAAECARAAISLGTARASRLQIEAIGVRKRGTGNARTTKVATELYRLLVDSFTPADFDAVKLDMADSARPTPYLLKHAIADVGWFEKRDMGAAYNELLELQPNAADASEMIYRSAFGYWGRYSRDPFRDFHLKPGPLRELDALERARVVADERFECLGEPPRSPEGGLLYADFVMSKLDRAMVYMAAHDWDRAATGLRDVAFHHPDTGEAATAGLRYVEILKSLSPERPACEVEVQREAAALYTLHCALDDDAHGDWDLFGRWGLGDRKAACTALRDFGATAIAPPIRPELPPLPAEPHEAKQPGLRGSDTTFVSGELPVESIEQIIHDHLGGAVACYEMALRKNASLQGQMVIEFLIGRDGSVSSVKSRSSDDLVTSKAADCIVHRFAAISFPQPEGGMVQMTYPLKLGTGRVIPPQPDDPVRYKLQTE